MRRCYRSFGVIEVVRIGVVNKNAGTARSHRLQAMASAYAHGFTYPILATRWITTTLKAVQRLRDLSSWEPRKSSQCSGRRAGPGPKYSIAAILEVSVTRSWCNGPW